MKRWKVVTLTVLLCLNILLSIFTYSIIYRKPYKSNKSPDRKSIEYHGHAAEVDQPIRVDAVKEYLPHPDVKTQREPLAATNFVSHRTSHFSDTDKHRQELLRLLNWVLIPSAEVCTVVSKLVIAVCSSVEHFDRREAIRSTWGNQTFLHHLQVTIVFIVAIPRPETEHLQPYLLQEHTTYGDIVQLNHTDHYKNLSLKSLGMLRWTLEHCKTTKFLLKTDDDVFVNVPNLVKHLGDKAGYGNRRTNFILGAIIHAAEPVRNRLSKWFTPYSVYHRDSYPPYSSGTAYVMSKDVVEKLFSLSLDHHIFWLEDIFLTGILAKELDIELIHDARFNYRKEKRKNLCWFKTAFTEHSQTPKDLLRIWNFASVNSEGNDLLWINCRSDGLSDSEAITNDLQRL